MNQYTKNAKIKAACLQMNSANDVRENLYFIEQALSKANEIDLLVLPENFAQMPARRSDQHIELANLNHQKANADDNLVQRFLVDIASRYQLHIVAGSLPLREASEEKPFARCCIVGPEGLIGQYDKIHLFDVDVPASSNEQADHQNRLQQYRESDSYQAGALVDNNTSLHTLNIGQNSIRLGASICYDLRFPELYRHFAKQGAEVITVPSAFTYQTGQAHWETMLRARAIENQSFVLAAAQTGKHANGRKTWGHSLIVDPWGEVLACKDSDLGLLYADLDLHRIEELRSSFPVQKHRRIDI